jgi:hypothetical protein
MRHFHEGYSADFWKMFFAGSRMPTATTRTCTRPSTTWRTTEWWRTSTTRSRRERRRRPCKEKVSLKLDPDKCDEGPILLFEKYFRWKIGDFDSKCSYECRTKKFGGGIKSSLGFHYDDRVSKRSIFRIGLLSNFFISFVISHHIKTLQRLQPLKYLRIQTDR